MTTEKFRDATLPLETRVDDLFSRLTLEEKVTLLAGSEAFVLHGVPRLGVPALKLTDGPTGVRSNQGKEATVFPTAVALAASFNPQLAHDVAAAIAREAHALGEVAILAPTINIVRTPVWGRNFETYSEDPHLTAEIAVAYVNGLQENGIGASLKHYAANNQELDRMSVSAELDERTLREIYLAAFEEVVKRANPWTVMASYNKINGTYASENRRLLTDILKTEWAYDGVVVSDWGAVHSTAPAANAGLDLEMPGPPRHFGDKLLAAVKNGEVSEKQLDDNARRMVRFILRTGALDDSTFPQPADLIGGDRHHAIAREAAEEGVVLVKNEGELLPFDPKAVRTLALIGPNAESFRMQGDGSSRVNTSRLVSLRDRLQSLLGAGVTIVHADGCDNEPFPKLAQRALFSTDESRDTEGLKSQYFAGADLAEPPLRSSVEKRFFRFMSDAAPPGTPMGYRWRGIFWPKKSGEHEFSIRGRGYASLELDGQPLISPSTPVVEANDDLAGPGSQRRLAGARLEAGRPYRIDVRFAFDRPRRLEYMHLGVREPSGTIAEAVAAAKSADAALVVIGSASTTEAEGYDRADLDLPGKQNELVAAVIAANPKTAVVLNIGSPMAMPWIDRARAVLVSWLPGEEGPNAIARTIFGASAPSGRLPVSFPKRLEDNPSAPHYRGGATAPYSEGLFVGYRHYDKTNVPPLFAFGHGLAYTTFSWSDLNGPERAKAGDTVTVNVTVENTGKRAGAEVVQLYVSPRSPSVTRPPKELKAFAKVRLAPGERKTVSLKLPPRAFSYYDDKKKQWTVEPGLYDLHAAASAASIRLTKTIRLEG
jgi:beta-glucosidase